MANAPGRIVNGFPSLVSSLAVPLTIIRCSPGVCQCQGTEQPAVNLAAMMDGPLEGSPFSTEAVAQVGSGGTPPNFISLMLRPTIWACAMPAR